MSANDKPDDRAHRPRRAALLLAVPIVVVLAVSLYSQPRGQALRPAGPPSPSTFGFAVPQPEPALPKTIDPYTPPQPGASGLLPTIAEHTRTADPGDSVLMAGEGFAKGSTKFTIFGQNAAVPAGVQFLQLPLAIEESTSALTLPVGLPARAMYMIYPTGGRLSAAMPIAINRTDARWVGPNSVPAGGTAAVFGRNLSYGQGNQTAYIYLKVVGSAARGRFAEIVAVNPYRVAFRIASDLKPGRYEAWAHNGHGGHFGWSGPVNLTVTSQSPWATTTTRIFSVTSYGAKGDGASDDAAAIDSALKAATAAAPATLYFPAGTYMVSHGFWVSSAVRWLGDGRDLTKIQAAANYSGAGYNNGFLIEGRSTGDPAFAASFENLTFDSNGVRMFDGRMIEIRGAHDVRFVNARLNSHQLSQDFTGTERLYMTRTEIVGAGVFFGDARQIFLDSNSLRMNYDFDGLFFTGAEQVSLTNNTMQDDDPSQASGYGSGRFIVAQSPSARDFYIAHNRTIALSPSVYKPDPNSGEQILFEAGGQAYSGFPSAATATSVTLPGSPTRNGWASHLDVVITQGKGMGQHREIVAEDDARHRLTVRPAFTVIPDSTSRVDVADGSFNIVVYRNSFEGKPDYASRRTASAGLEPWGYAYDWIADANSFRHLRTAISVWALGHGGSTVRIRPASFNLFMNNVVIDCLTGIQLVSSGEQSSAGKDAPAGLTSNVFRKNTFNGIVGTVLSIEGPGDVRMNSFERNRAMNVHRGVIAQAASEGSGQYSSTLLLNNTFSAGSARSATSTGISWGPNSTWVTSGTSFLGFSSGFALP